MDKNVLDKWLDGTHTAEELKALEQDPTFAAYRKIDRFAKQIELPPFDTEGSLASIKEKLANSQRKKPKVRVLPALLKIAAVLALVLVSYVFINALPTTINTQLAETTTLTLPDTSEILLNENSEISYQKNSWNENRMLSLNGEAYFKVAKGETFTVNTPQGTITVLGTQFNVTATNNTFQVHCYEGLVAVTYNNETIKLPAGNGVTVTNEILEQTKVFVNKPEWHGNESSYDNVRITDVLKDLEQNYNTTVSTQNIDVTLRFTGSYTHTDLEAALQTITLPLGLTYAIESEDSVIISTAKNKE
ncbi:FecR family protein [Rasiella rasia]|uniref:FecR family protein n=1 Tax=Rasiella rasia TaxID=2744027 RepID=A0A6G6GL26_9FLAO|nr:FecR family protein [Rasiella rasia]QIE59190.1 FecR family protein [Rasiella rasia]